MKRKNSSLGERRTSKRLRAKLESVSHQAEPQQSSASPTIIPSNPDESQAPTASQRPTESQPPAASELPAAIQLPAVIPLPAISQLPTPSQFPTTSQLPADNQEEVQSDEPQADEQPFQKRIAQAIHRYEKDDYAERDLWDTVLQLAYQQSQNLSKSLVYWGRQGGLRGRRSIINPSSSKTQADSDDPKAPIYDPTADCFTLWPLSGQSCPTPEWTLYEELSSLVTRIVKKNPSGNCNDNLPIDDDLENKQAEGLVDENRNTLMKLLNNLYEFHPPHSSGIPIFTRGKLYKKTCKPTKPPSGKDQSTDPNNQKQVDFGLDWKFVLGVASSTLDLKESVLQRTRERLSEMYRVTLETRDGEATGSASQTSQVANSDLTQSIQKYRDMKPSKTSDSEDSS